ncbi:hypothetical protein PEX1_088120 [Penicillium expansum]|uniref:Uncharacterized protein n=1 Tax=Penicillium expansum TaxID=27334 RepID=A0A0A2K0Z7_PENEN|nr:hypothetical protein PEX2_087500 [Penicillium expansum]KGO35892.1 hypothetical protein PEXP_036800 [Penicillium expansum]KGO43484.1 hypothetical protein PEX1_088120 [Penicillium expansum]KGO60568.1 hypothetical protein PEX2_087500 [Penicillium expansum]
MTSPVKGDGKLSELKAADARLLIYGALCCDGKIDFEKLASFAGIKKTSASTNYWRAKNNLQQILGLSAASPTQAIDPKNDDAKNEDVDDADTGSPKKTAARAKRGTAKDASTKKEPAKRRKTVSKTTSQVVDSAQAEDASDIAPADTVDQTK